MTDNRAHVQCARQRMKSEDSRRQLQRIAANMSELQEAARGAKYPQEKRKRTLLRLFAVFGRLPDVVLNMWHNIQQSKGMRLFESVRAHNSGKKPLFLFNNILTAQVPKSLAKIMKNYKLSDLRIERKQNATTVAGNIRLLLACKGNIEKCISLYGKGEQIFMLAHIIEQEQGIGQEYTVKTAKGEVKRIRKASQDIVLRWFVTNQEKAEEYKKQTAAKIAERKEQKKAEKEQEKNEAA